MTTFIDFKKVVQKQFKQMSQGEMFTVDFDKYELWDLYLDSFPEGTNNIYRERREYDCQCCKQFIRNIGGVVSIKDGVVTSLWDIEVGGYYQPVVEALSAFIKSKPIKGLYRHYESHVGTDKNHELKDDTVKEWSHFYVDLPSQYVMNKDSIASHLGDVKSNKDVLQRSLEELTLESAEIVLELIEQNSLYRGEEHKWIVESFIKYKKEYDKLTTPEEKELHCWNKSLELGGNSKIRNTVIGSLLSDLSDGRELDIAVSSFETKVAPTNYKRPTALVTKSMIENAQKKVMELGYEESLARRYAVVDDLTINNVLFADRSAKKAMNVFDELIEQTPQKLGNLSKVEEVGIEHFINDIVPKADSIELYFENKHKSNLVSLVAPVNQASPNMLKWGNNFSWAYNGDIADSMKDRVKAAGGDVTGVLRFSIQWNEDGNDNIDFDAHCVEPSGNRIMYNNKRNLDTTGQLDVDIQHPGRSVAVENITWSQLSHMREGVYEMIVHNYSSRTSNGGFSAELEYDGTIYSFNYQPRLKGGEYVCVAKFKFSKTSGIEFIKSLPSDQSSQKEWDINTQNFHKVNMIMNSPNHWDGEETGNKHWFFMLDGCKNEGKARGFFNEFLSNELTEHRKVFEMLGSKMKTEESDNQLSGLGFSSTQRNEAIFKVKGSFNRTIKVKF